MPLFQIGVVTVDTPGPFNADTVTEDFGSDYAVKPIVGARQDREFDGPADQHMTISGSLFPYFYARAQDQSDVKGTGLSAVQMLRKMCDEGKPQTVMNGAHQALGSFYVEKVTLKSTRLAASGIGQVITYDISLVRSGRDPAPEDQAETLAIIQGSLISLYN